MKFKAVLCLLFLLLYSCAERKSSVSEPQNENFQPQISIQVFPDREPVTVILPRKFQTMGKIPLIVLLHGYGASGSLQNAYLAVSSFINEKGFALALPDGLKNSTDKRYWNASPACCDFEHYNPDDVGFLSTLVEKAKELAPIDAARVSFLGHSNGGFMAYRMACDKSEMIASIGVLAGSYDPDIESQCAGALPVSALHVHGTKDEVISYYGRAAADAAGSPYLGATPLTWAWANHNRCASVKATEGVALDFVSVLQLPGRDTRVKTWFNCEDNVTVELATIVSGVHKPIFSIDRAFMRHTVDFLLAARRKGAH